MDRCSRFAADVRSAAQAPSSGFTLVCAGSGGALTCGSSAHGKTSALPI
jgi:hypothetical protein